MENQKVTPPNGPEVMGGQADESAVAERVYVCQFQTTDDERLVVASGTEQAKRRYVQLLAEAGIHTTHSQVAVTETDMPVGSEQGLPDSVAEKAAQMTELLQTHPIVQVIEGLQRVNPDAKIENKCLGTLEEGRVGWSVTVLGPSVSLTSVLRIPGLELVEIVTKRTGRFTRTLMIFLIGEAPAMTPVEQQHRDLCERLDVDALLIVGVKRPGPDRPEQGEQTLIGTENTGLSLGEMHGIAARWMNEVNNAYVAENEFPPFPFVSSTGQLGGSLLAPKPKSIITRIN